MAWRTARVRLTALYGAMFLLSGGVLLAVADILVGRTTGTVVYSVQETPAAAGSGPSPGPEPIPVQAHDLQSGLTQLHAADLHRFFIRSGLALGLATLSAVALGYLVAGRVLRPVRTITSKARTISASSLHKRLALDGPADELRELGETIDELLERLERSFLAQHRFIANASHELRTPLARQRTIAEVALDDPAATVGTLRAAHERIIAANVQQERIIEALLALARGQAGTNRREPFDLAPIARTVLTACRAQAVEAADVTVHADLGPAPVVGDPHLTERLVTNLVDNALRYNAVGGCVRVHTRIRDSCSILLVANSGPVIPADALDRLFQPFTRLDADRTNRREGLGLGLSIVRAIADAHDAVLVARPGREGGLTVEIAFPNPDISARAG
ncbi:MAG: HAMP domain-containing protein [Catenulispora sp.]|nr:HAMP domain-containing protein [Catenulispora sp.]